MLEFDFLLGSHDFLAIDLHDLEPRYFVPHQPYEVHILRWLAIDPLFVFGFAIFLADFLRRAALRRHHHVPVHANQNFVFLDGVAHFGRKRVKVGFHSGFGIEVKNRSQQIFQLLRVEFGYITFENQIYVGAARIGIRVAGSDRRSLLHRRIECADTTSPALQRHR